MNALVRPALAMRTTSRTRSGRTWQSSSATQPPIEYPTIRQGPSRERIDQTRGVGGQVGDRVRRRRAVRRRDAAVGERDDLEPCARRGPGRARAAIAPAASRCPRSARPARRRPPRRSSGVSRSSRPCPCARSLAKPAGRSTRAAISIRRPPRVVCTRSDKKRRMPFQIAHNPRYVKYAGNQEDPSLPVAISATSDGSSPRQSEPRQPSGQPHGQPRPSLDEGDAGRLALEEPGAERVDVLERASGASCRRRFTGAAKIRNDWIASSRSPDDSVSPAGVVVAASDAARPTSP